MDSLLAKLPPFQNKRHVIVHSQSVGDIMQGILQTHSKYTKEYDILAPKFAGRSAEQIARNVYNYLKENTHYVIESDSRQTLRSPSAILALGANPKIGLDCKSYSLFIAGILSAWQRKGMRINWCYRFASYRLTDKLPHHVFVVLNPNTNNEIFVDPVLPTFNNRKTYFYKIDRKPMALVAVAGIGKVKRSRAEKIARRKEVKAKIKAKIKKAGKIVLKFNPATAAARNSFLLLVKLNVFNLGRKLYIAQTKSAAKLKKFWESIGGNYRTLSVAIGQGANKQPQLSGIGFAPAVPAALAAATPIILKVKQFLQENGIEVGDIAKKAKELVSAAIEKKIEAKADSITNEEEGTVTESEEYKDMNIPDTAADAISSQDEPVEGGDEIAGIPKNTLLIGGAALAAAYFLMRKK
jgi:hypothetical protein